MKKNIGAQCEMDGNYELESFDNFFCKILATYEYFKTGEKVGDCARMEGK